MCNYLNNYNNGCSLHSAYIFMKNVFLICLVNFQKCAAIKTSHYGFKAYPFPNILITFPLFHSSTLFTHIPFPLTFCYIIYLNINTEELSRYVAKVVPVNEITDSNFLFSK